MIGGLRVQTSDACVIGPFEDWSKVRSPGRARRRRRKYKQNIRVYYQPDPQMYRMGEVLIGHPRTIDTLMRGYEAGERVSIDLQTGRPKVAGALG